MKTLPLLFVVFILFSCQFKTQQESLAADTTATDTTTLVNDPAYQSPGPEPIVSSYQFTNDSFDAFVLPGTWMYADSTGESEGSGPTESLLPVKIVFVSKLAYPIDGDICAQFPYYRVIFPDNSISWVYGDYVFISSRNNKVSQFEFKEKSYSVYYAFDTGTGVSNDMGLTGCNQYVMPYFLNESDKSFHFLEYQIDSYNMVMYWLSFQNSEGGSTDISSVSIDDKGIVLNTQTDFQDGGAKGRILVELKDGNFIAVSSEAVLDQED